MNWLNIISVSFLLGLFPVLDFPALNNSARAFSGTEFRTANLQNDNNFKMITVIEYKKL